MEKAPQIKNNFDKRLEIFLTGRKYVTDKIPGFLMCVKANDRVNEYYKFPDEFAQVVLKYQRENVINKFKDISRADCARVAIDAVLPLKNALPEGTQVRTLSITGKTVIPFFKDKGFTNHVMNVARYKGNYYAFDLTSHYNLDNKRGGFSVFCIRDTDFTNLKKTVGDFFETKPFE